MAPAQIHTYDVLYYKHKKNKKKHSASEKKMDGKLVFDNKKVQLVGEDTASVLARSMYRELIEKAHNDQWCIDDTLVLGQFECEVQSQRLDSAGNPLPAAATKLKPTTEARGSIVMKKPYANKTLPSRAIVKQISPLVSSNLNKHRTASAIRAPPAQPRRVVSQMSSKPLKRKAPLQPLQKMRPVPASKKRLSKNVLPQRAHVASSSAVLSHLDIPHSIRNALRPHQIQGVDFLASRILGGEGAILADEMGLGKTMMTVSVLTALYRTNREKHFLVVCPSSLVSNWCQEFDKWIGKACQPKRVTIKAGGAEAEQQIRSFGHSRQGQVLIVSYDLFRRHAPLLKTTQFGLLIVDEGHRLKNKNGSQTLEALNSVHTDTKLLLTATPMQNCLSEFYALANFVCPGQLGNHADFVKQYANPITAANRKGASQEVSHKGKMAAQALDKITPSFMLRRLQSEVLAEMLPPRNEFLVFIRPSEVQRKEYSIVCDSVRPSLPALTELRRICAHPTDERVASSSKFEVLKSLLQCLQATEDKVVIVSNFTSTLAEVEKLVMNDGTFLRLDGSVASAHRQALVDTFHNVSAYKFLLLSSKAGGCGLNLVGANRIILLDPDWNPASDIQAMGRVYRQGQKKTCFVYRFFTSGTVEEIIYQRQVQKGSLAALSTGASGNPCFTPEELADCFTLHAEADCTTREKLGWGRYTGPHDLPVDDAALLETCQKHAALIGHIQLVPSATVNINPKPKAPNTPSTPRAPQAPDSLSSEEEFDWDDSDE